MISIILSAYNASATIARALDSCLAQTYKDFEVVVVNDCSTDNTKEIIKYYAERDSKIKYFENIVNEGAGYSRWVGTHNIKGEYCIFLDSDDYFKEDLLETLYNAAIKHGSDLTCSGFIATLNDKEFTHVCSDRLRILEGKDKYATDIPNRAYLFIHGTLIKSSLWERVEYSKERFIEDSPTLIQLIWYANKRVYIPYAGYYYTQNDSSLIHTASKFKEWVYRCLCAISAVEFFKDKDSEFCNIGSLFNVINSIPNSRIKKEEYNLYKDKIDYIIDYYNANNKTTYK